MIPMHTLVFIDWFHFHKLLKLFHMFATYWRTLATVINNRVYRRICTICFIEDKMLYKFCKRTKLIFRPNIIEKCKLYQY